MVAPSPSKSFADIISANSSSSSLTLKPPEKFKGLPAISFSDAEIELLAQPFKFALIGKFPHGRPTLSVFRKAFDAVGFGGAFSIGLLDQKHFLLNFDLEEDFQRCWLRKSWTINGFIMQIFKWSPDFRPDLESPVVPIWIALEGLPAHLHDKRALYSIADLIGKPLKVDSSTLSLNRPSVARICVEIDVSKAMPDSVWITNGSYGSFSQPIAYEDVPEYCNICKKFGHSKASGTNSDHRFSNEAPRPKKTIWIKWQCPPPGRLKLNTDASFSSNSCGGGAVIRNSIGALVAALTFPLSASSALEAEALALAYAMTWCDLVARKPTLVEIDSLALLKLIVNNRATLPCAVRHSVILIRQLLSSWSASIAHSYREANTVADVLASIGCSLDSPSLYFDLKSLPSSVRHSLLYDQRGFSAPRLTY